MRAQQLASENRLAKAKKPELLLILVLFGAFCLRVFRLDGQSMWWDEIFSVAVARLRLPDLLAYIFWQDRAQTPGFFALMSYWTMLGDGEFIARYVSVFSGVISIALIYQVGRRVGGRQVGILATLLLASSPFQLWYSQEARVYALEGFWVLLSSYLFFQLLQAPRWRYALALALTNALGLYFHYLFSMLIFAQAVFLVLLVRRYRATLQFWSAATILTGLCFSPWIVAVLRTGGLTAAGIDWIPSVQWYDLMLSIYTFLLGATNNPNDLLNWLTPVIMAALAGYGVWTTRKTGQHDAVTYLVLWMTVPIAVMFLISLPLYPSKRSIYVDRYMLGELPPLIILIALGTRRWVDQHPRIAVIGLALASVPIALSISNMYFDPAFGRDDWRGTAAYIAAHADPSADRVAFEASSIMPYRHYDRANLSEIPFTLVDHTVLDSSLDSIIDSGLHSRLWLITGTGFHDVHGFPPSLDQRMATARRDDTKRLLDSRFPVEKEVLFQGNLLTLYRVAP